MPYQTQSAILLTVFNRPHNTKKVFEQIRAAKPARLYIAADGPRASIPEDAKICVQTRAITHLIDWPCELKTLFRTDNLGCKEAMASAISWFFSNEEEGIILEDDCLPSISFFEFCDVMLNKYKFDSRIRHISGANFQNGKSYGTGSYYFSNLTHVWGWASWRRVWNEYDKDLKRYEAADVREQLGKIFASPFILDSWEDIFNAVKNSVINTWDYQLTFINFFNNSLSIIPNQNLISNIGFGPNATHTSEGNSRYAALPAQELTQVIHPNYILPEKQADLFTLSYDFDLQNRLAKHNKPSRRFKRWIKGL